MSKATVVIRRLESEHAPDAFGKFRALGKAMEAEISGVIGEIFDALGGRSPLSSGIGCEGCSSDPRPGRGGRRRRSRAAAGRRGPTSRPPGLSATTSLHCEPEGLSSWTAASRSAGRRAGSAPSCRSCGSTTCITSSGSGPCPGKRGGPWCWTGSGATASGEIAWAGSPIPPRCAW